MMELVFDEKITLNADHIVSSLSFSHTQPIADPKLIFSIRITKPP